MIGKHLPKYITVMAQRIPINTQDDLIPCGEATGVANDKAYGHYTTDGPAILLALAQGGERLRETLLHESLHALIGQSAVGILIPDDNMEPFVSYFAPALLAFIRDNPHVVNFLMTSE